MSGAQRRQVTVLFCDLAGSAELGARIDPEDMRDVLHAYLNAFAARIEAMGGFIARYMGDGVMAYFGYPLAREGDPARAVRAALDVIESAAGLAPHGHRLAVRCGIATGLSVVGDLIGKGASSERGIIGTAPNLASRLQGAAQENEAVMCAATARLTEGLFETRDLGALALKGFGTAERAFAVSGRQASTSRPQEHGDAAPMIGRQRESARLAAAWKRAANGGRMVFTSIVGDGGIGKSRLVAAFRQSLSDTPHLWLQAGGDPTLEGQAYGFVSRMVRGRLGGDADLTAAGLAPRLERAGLPSERAAILAGAVSGQYTAADDPGGDLDVADRRRALMRTLIDWVVARARRKPTVVVLEDLHWVDPSSLDLLRALVAERPAVPLLIVTSSRPEFRIAGRFAMAPRLVELGRLGGREIATIAANAAGGPIAPRRLHSIVARADGNPLFARELAAHVGSEFGKDTLPETLVGLLTARLDATGDGARLASAAAVIGRRFEAGLLGKVAQLPKRAVNSGLDALAKADLVGPDGEGFQFRHALIREAAYDTLLKDDRRVLHRRAALALDKASAANGLAVARHWREAGEPRRAVDTYRDLGRRNAAARAFGEAAQAYHAALEVLDDLPPSSARDREDMDISSALANVLQITDGYAAPAPMATAARARRLAERLGDRAKMFAQLSADWMAATSGGSYALARELVARAMPLAEAEGTPEALSMAYMMQMTAAYRVGALAEGEAAFRAGAPYFRSSAFRRRPGAVPQTFGNAAIIAWLRGQEAAARKRIERVAAYGRRADSAYARVFADNMAAMQFVIMGDFERGAEFARDAMTKADTEGFPQFAATARIILGRAMARTGRRRQGIELMTAGISRMEINGASNGMTMYLTWLAQSHVEAGEKAEARKAAARALSINPAERFFRAEALRVSALTRDARAETIAELAEAIEVADAMGSTWQAGRARASFAAALEKGGGGRAFNRRV